MKTSSLVELGVQRTTLMCCLPIKTSVANIMYLQNYAVNKLFTNADIHLLI